MIPVEGHKNLFRDESTGAIINCDNTAYQNYLEDKKRNSIKKAEIEPHGPIGDRWYEIFEETHAKTKMSVSLYEPSPERKAIKFTTFKKDGSQNLDMDLWVEGEDWQPFIEANKKFFAFIRRNK